MVSENLSNLKEITPGVYFRAGDMTRGQCNGGFIVCDDYVMAIDAPTPEGVAEMFGEAKERSEEHTSELQSHSFISYAVFCLKKKKKKKTQK